MNWNKAREAYSDVQKSIVRGDQLELYDDVERLLPNHIKPQCLEMVMEIEEYDRSATEKSRETTTREPSKKRKRNNDPIRDIPPGACTGFVSVAELLEKQKVKRQKKAIKFDENAGIDDDTDEEIEGGLFPPRRAASTSATTSTKPPKTKLKRAKTAVDRGKKRQTTMKKTKARVDADISEPSPGQFSRKGAEDSDDMAIERGPWSNSHPPSPRSSPVRIRSSSPDIPLAQNQSIIDICTSAAPSRCPSPRNKGRYSTPPRPTGEVPASRYPSPSLPHSPSVAPEPSFGGASPSEAASDHETAPETKESEAVIEDDSLAWLLADSDDGAMPNSPVAGPRSQMLRSPGSDAIEIEDSEPENGSPIVLNSSPVRANGPPIPSNRDMPPPAPLLRPRRGSPSLVAPSPSLPVRAAGQAKRRPLFAPAPDSSSPLQPPPHSQKRLYRHNLSPNHDDCPPNASPTSHHPPKKKRKPPTTKKRQRLKVRHTAEAARMIPWIDLEAMHSGDEVSGGGLSSAQEDEEGESVGGFITDLPATQPSASYDQSAVYRQSLLSQAPVRNSSGNKNKFSVPVFAGPPARRSGVPLRGPPAVAGAAAHHQHHERRAARSSSPVSPADEEDCYMFGSFVVDDEAEISFTQSSEP
jgi:ATP-dependent DNA helicase MPH1